MSQAAWAEFAQRVNRARIEQHLSIGAVAKVAGAPKATVQGWLNGRHSPTPALRQQYLGLVAALGLSEDIPDGLWLDEWERIEPQLRTGEAPYRGLHQFAPADVDYFFGRAAESRRLAEAVIERREAAGHGVVVVVGPSGSGKSSLVAAGLIGREGTDGLLRGWRITSVSSRSEGDAITSSDLAVWDQFENVLLSDGEERAAAVELLGQLAADRVVLVVLRSDAFAEAQGIPVLNEALARPFLLSALTEAELREVISGPAAIAGVKVDAELVEVLVHELISDSGRGDVAPEALPLLSNALLVTWAAGSGSRMTLADYRRVGGVAGAVELLAEQVFDELDQSQKHSAQLLFLRLISVTPHGLVRHAIPLAEVDATTLPVTQAFVAARMLTIAEDHVRISHEVLIRHWHRLNDWAQEHAQTLQSRERLQRAAELWRDTDRDPATLIPVERIMPETSGPDGGTASSELLGSLEREFLGASKAHFATELEQEKGLTTRLRRRGRAALALAAAASLAAIGAGTFFVRGEGFRLEAEQGRDDAQSRQTALSARSLAQKAPNLEAQLALIANAISPTLQGRSSVLNATSHDIPLRRLGDVDPVLAVSADGSLVVRASSAGVLTWWRGDGVETSAGSVVSADPKNGRLLSAAITHVGGRDLVAVGGANVLQLWDFTAEPKLITELPHTATTTAVGFDPAGSVLVVGDEAGAVTAYRVDASGASDPIGQVQLAPTADQPTKVTAVAASAGGVIYVGGATGAVDRWRIATGGLYQLPALENFAEGTAGRQPLIALCLAVRPDGHEVVAGVTGYVVQRWSVQTDGATTQATPLADFKSWINAVAYSADGSRLGVASSDQTVSVWDSATGTRLRTLVTAGALAEGGLARAVSLVAAVAFEAPLNALHTKSFDELALAGAARLPSETRRGRPGEESIALARD